MFEIDKEKLGAFISQLRKEKGYTQKELAEQLFLSNKAISKWETGASNPIKFNTVAKTEKILASALVFASSSTGSMPFNK